MGARRRCNEHRSRVSVENGVGRARSGDGARTGARRK